MRMAWVLLAMVGSGCGRTGPDVACVGAVFHRSTDNVIVSAPPRSRIHFQLASGEVLWVTTPATSRSCVSRMDALEACVDEGGCCRDEVRRLFGCEGVTVEEG